MSAWFVSLIYAHNYYVKQTPPDFVVMNMVHYINMWFITNIWITIRFRMARSLSTCWFIVALKTARFYSKFFSDSMTIFNEVVIKRDNIGVNISRNINFDKADHVASGCCRYSVKRLGAQRVALFTSCGNAQREYWSCPGV